MYHTDNTSLRWFESYLHDQTQRCCINGSLSDTLPITQGVPQGSILGPILFLLYINDLPLAIPDCNVDIYADDTTLWMANSNPLHIQHGLQGSLNKANHWFSLNKMVPNAKKQNSYLMEPSKNFPTAQTHRLTFRCKALKSKRTSTRSCLV